MRAAGLARAARAPALAVLSGALLVLAFPAPDLSALAWVALVPLLAALEGATLRRGFALGHAAGIVFFAGIFSWTWTIPTWNRLDDIVTKGLYLPLFLSLWALSVMWVRGRTAFPAVLVAPPLWVAFEYLRGHAGFLSLPWLLLGYSQHARPSLVQVSAWTGVYGVSFLVVLVNAALADALAGAGPWRRGRRMDAGRLGRALAPLAVAGLLVAGAVLYGHVVLAGPEEGEGLPVAIVQGNIPQGPKWTESFRLTILDRYTRHTRAVGRERPALVVWPESAVPGDVEHSADLRRLVSRLAVETGSHLLVGSSEAAKFTRRELEGKRYNSLVLFSPEGQVTGVYRKMALVPFGEYIPLREHISWPKALVGTMGDHLPGDQFTAFTVGGVTFRALICWEIIFPDLVRDSVRRGTRFLVLATNEAWFGDTAAPHQMLAMTVFRAAEHRVAIARAANSGVSAIIDRFGRISRRLVGPGGRDVFVEGTLAAPVPLAGASATFYTRHGDLFALAQIALSGLMLTLGLVGAPVLRAPRGRPALGLHAESPTKGAAP